MPDRPNFPIPEDLTPDTFCLCLQIPNDPTWKRVFAGLLAQPAYWFNWQRDTARSGKILGQYWTQLFDQIDWSDMSCCCNDNAIYTYDAEGNLEVSTDGGVTYTPAPQDDIRINPQVVFPEPPSEEGVDELCLAADGMVNLIKEQIGEQLTDDMSRYTLGKLLSDWTNTVIGTSNPFQALVTIVTNQIFALLISAVRAALTEDVYFTLRCIFSANILPDISFDVAAWENVRTDTTGQISGIAGIFLEHLEYLLGSGGLTNLARSMAGVDDSACCPDCSADMWHIVNYSGTNVGSIIATGTNWITVQGGGHPEFGTPWNAMIQTDGNSICCIPVSVEWLTGDHDDENLFGVDCEAARWPGSPNGAFDMGVAELNTVYLRKDAGSNFTAKITFA